MTTSGYPSTWALRAYARSNRLEIGRYARRTATDWSGSPDLWSRLLTGEAPRKLRACGIGDCYQGFGDLTRAARVEGSPRVYPEKFGVVERWKQGGASSVYDQQTFVKSRTAWRLRRQRTS